MGFVVKTVFIKILGTDYLGVNGLFTNILTILSFAELGIGTSIIYSMYKPISVNDTNKIKSLMKLYKDTYKLLGILILIVGISFIPFINLLLKEKPNISDNLMIIYILFLIETTSSYFFTYKISMKEYILKYIKYYIVFIINILLVFICINVISINNNILDIIVKLLLSIIITIVINIIIFRNYKENKLLKNRFMLLIKKLN